MQHLAKKSVLDFRNIINIIVTRDIIFVTVKATKI